MEKEINSEIRLRLFKLFSSELLLSNFVLKNELEISLTLDIAIDLRILEAVFKYHICNCGK